MKKNGSSVKTKLLYSFAMLAVSAVVLTTASYAWFSMSNQPKVDDITLTAGSFGSLQICKTESGTFGQNVDLSGDIVTGTVLRPITSTDGKNFYKPKYGTDGKVNGVEASPVTDLSAIANKTQANGGYLAMSTFYLKATGGTGNVKVQLSSGSKVENLSSGEAAYATRIAFMLNDGTGKVYEPNADASASGAENQYEMPGFTSLKTLKQKAAANNEFQIEGSSGYISNVSDDLFSIPNNTATKVTMYIWLEGSDKDCVNSISAKDLKVSVQFTSSDL